MNKYQVLSPDNLPINCEGGVYKSLKQAKDALKLWINNYKTHG